MPKSYLEWFDEVQGTAKPTTTTLPVKDLPQTQPQPQQVQPVAGAAPAEKAPRKWDEYSQKERALIRGDAAFPITKKGTVQYLQGVFGPYRVSMKDDEILIDDQKFDPGLFEGGTRDVLADIAEFAPDLMETIPAAVLIPFGARLGSALGAYTGGPKGLISGGVAGGALGGVAGDILGTTARLATARYVVGTTGATPEEEMEHIGWNAALGMGLGAAAEGVGKLIGKTATALSRERRLQKAVAKEAKEGAQQVISTEAVGIPSFVEEGLQIEKDIVEGLGGETFAFGPTSLSGSATTAMVERQFAQTPGLSDKFYRSLAGRINKVAKFLDLSLDTEARHLGRAEVGQGVKEGLSSFVTHLDNTRKKLAGPLFERAKRTTQKVELPNTIRLLKEMSLRGQRGATTATQRAVGQGAAQWMDEIGGGVSVARLQELLADAGRGARGKENIFGNLETRHATAPAKRILGALQADLGASSSKSLRQARAIWAAYGKQIDNADIMAVRRIMKLGDEMRVEDIPKELLRKTPKEITHVMSLLEASDKVTGNQTAKQTRSGAFNLIMQQAAPPPGSQLAVKGAKIAPARAISVQRKFGDQMEALFPKGSKHAKDVRTAFRAFERLGIGAGLLGAQTAPALQTGKIMALMEKMPFSGNMKKVLRNDLSSLTDDIAFFNTINTPEGAKAMAGVGDLLISTPTRKNAMKLLRGIGVASRIYREEAQELAGLKDVGPADIPPGEQ